MTEKDLMKPRVRVVKILLSDDNWRRFRSQVARAGKTSQFVGGELIRRWTLMREQKQDQ